MKRILYFMPDLLLESNAGNITRILAILHYFRNRGFKVDYFGIKDWGVDWDENKENENKQKILNTGLVENVYASHWRPERGDIPFLKRLLTYKIPEFLQNKRYRIDNRAIRNYSSAYLRRKLNRLLKENTYDYIIINYSWWAYLIKDNEFVKNAYTIVDTHDFLTIHQYKKTKKNLGRTFEEEIKRLSFFDEVWAISVDEFYLFSQFLDNKIRTILPSVHVMASENDNKEKKYDLVYVASNNDFNKKSAAWFVNEVYPLLPPDISICVVGKIGKYMPEYPNIEKISFIEKLKDVYQVSKVALCPMLDGTGIKIKVVEAMAYGLPVVCTLRGIDGLPNKINNGCLVDDTPQGFANNIKKLLTDSDLYSELSRQGHSIYTNCFCPEKVYQKLDAVFLPEKE